MRMPEPNGDFELPPEGTHPARCYRVVDLGTQKVEWQGQQKHQRKVLLSWELPTELTNDGQPFTAHQRYTFSSSDKSTFRKHLESWRGKRFVESDFGPNGFDIRNLIGVPCLLMIVHSTKNDRTYANIDSVVKPPRGFDIPDQFNQTVFLSLEPGEFDATTYALLPERLQEVIKQSPEYLEVINGSSRKPNGNGQSDDELDDDIPF